MASRRLEPEGEGLAAWRDEQCRTSNGGRVARPIFRDPMIGLTEQFGGSAEEPLQLDLEATVAEVFRTGGMLEGCLGLQHRPQQARMALATAQTWLRDEALFFEAGTGVGKSLAYLVPGILRAVSAKRPLIVSTHTIALQEQILGKDLEICRKLFEAVPQLKPFAGFKAALMLGKSNYVCGSRLRQALQTKMELFQDAGQEELARIAAWARHSETGLRKELSPPPRWDVWEWVQADAEACNRRNCSPQTCFYRKAWEALRGADLVVVNHSLLFSLLAAGHFPGHDVPGILLPEDFLVLDEAHTVPSVATEYLGMRIGEASLRRHLHKLYQGGANKGKGLLTRQPDPGARRQVLELDAMAGHFWDAVREEFLSQDRPFRLRQPGWIKNPLNAPLLELLQSLQKLESRLPEGAPRDELTGCKHALDSFRCGLMQAIELADKEAVYWLEKGYRDRVEIRSAPLDIAGPMRERIFARRTGVLLTSATLAEGPSMDSIKHRLGAPDAAHQQQFSPFDYQMQMNILLHRDAPAPESENFTMDTRFMAAEILRLFAEVEGGTLALFTSYRDLLAVERAIRAKCAAMGRPLLHQDGNVSRSELLERMQASGNALLLGTDSFWTGIDVAGPALSQVIITRLPFENPSHPVLEARGDWCRSRGLNPFQEITLPAALVKFRQGIGRLIRSHSDEGRLVVLDSRIVRKPYGRLFLDVLPHSQWQVIP